MKFSYKLDSSITIWGYLHEEISVNLMIVQLLALHCLLHCLKLKDDVASVDLDSEAFQNSR